MLKAYQPTCCVACCGKYDWAERKNCCLLAVHCALALKPHECIMYPIDASNKLLKRQFAVVGVHVRIRVKPRQFSVSHLLGYVVKKELNIAAPSLCLLFDPMNIAIAESFLCQSFAGARIKSCLLFHSMNIAIAESFLCQSFAGARIKSCLLFHSMNITIAEPVLCQSFAMLMELNLCSCQHEWLRK